MCWKKARLFNLRIQPALAGRTIGEQMGDIVRLAATLIILFAYIENLLINLG